MRPDIYDRMLARLNTALDDLFEDLSYTAARLRREGHISDEDIRLMLAQELGIDMADRWQDWTEEP